MEEEEEEEEAVMHQSVVVRHCSGRGVEADIPGEQQALGWSVEEEEEEEEEEDLLRRHCLEWERWLVEAS